MGFSIALYWLLASFNGSVHFAPFRRFCTPRRLALCERLRTPLCGVLAAGSIGIAPPPGVALWGVYGRLWRCYSRGCGLLAPVRRCGRLCGLFRGLPVPLYPCPVAWLCAPSVAAVGVAVLWAVHCSGVAAVGCPAGQRKARASCTSSTRAQKNRRRDCTRGGSVVSFIHFQQFGQDSERDN